MLTDLRDRLKGVGRLDVMTAVNERAMGYYGGDTVKGRLLKARILHALGEDDDKRGKKQLAARRFAQAERITSAAVLADPDDGDAIYAHAQSTYWIGYAAMRNSDIGRMRTRFAQYKRLADRLADFDARKPEWIKEAGFAEGNLCTAMLEPPAQPRRALRHCQGALARMKQVDKLLKSPSDTQRSIANRYGWLADAYVANGDHEKALEARRAQQVVVDRLIQKDRSNVLNLEAWVAAKLSIGKLLRTADKNIEAETYLILARSGISSLLQIEPTNSAYKSWQKLAV